MSGFAAVLNKALDTLEHEHPSAYRAFWQQLIMQNIRLNIDNECIDVFADNVGIKTTPPRGSATTRIACNGQTLVNLLSGDIRLTEALMNDLLQIHGKPEHLQLAQRSLTTWLRGGMGCPSYPSILEQYKQQVAGTKQWST